VIEYSIWLGSLNIVMDTAAKVKMGHERYVPEHSKYAALKGPTMTAGFSEENGVYGYMTQRAGIKGRTAVLNIQGGMVQRSEWWHEYVGISSYEAINSALMAASNDESVDSILLVMDTPGGMVSGIDSVTDTMARIEKPIIAYTDGVMASAGYWIGSNADMVISSKLATVGSVGALVIRQDITKMLEDYGVKMEIFRAGDNKARMNPYEDMREEDKEYLLAELDESYQAFLDQVAIGRAHKVSRHGLEGLTEHGRTFSGKKAFEKKLVDYNSSLLEVVEQIDEKVNNNTQAPLLTVE